MWSSPSVATAMTCPPRLRTSWIQSAWVHGADLVLAHDTPDEGLRVAFHDLLARIDREAAGAGNRSSVIERWLRRAAADATRREIDEATERYYDRVTDDEALSRSLSRAARKLRVDDA